MKIKRSAISIAVVLLIGSVGAWTVQQHFQKPGQLVCNNPIVEWRSPMPDSAKDKASVEVADATFELINVGYSTVKIISMESGCGCTKPRVQPEIVNPGSKAIVYVRAIPLYVGVKNVNISINTDSEVAPNLTLTLRLIGAKDPPFLLDIRGDLTFNVKSSLINESREITVLTVERNVQSEGKVIPVVLSSIEGLKTELLSKVEKPYYNKTSKYIEYTFKVSLNEMPRIGTTVGEVIAVDPWEESHTESIKVLINKVPLLRCIPSRIIHRIDSWQDYKTITNFVLVWAGNGEIPELEFADEDMIPFVLEEIGKPNSNTDKTLTQRYSIRLKKRNKGQNIKNKEDVNNILSKEYHIKLKSRDDHESLTIPLMIVTSYN